MRPVKLGKNELFRKEVGVKFNEWKKELTSFSFSLLYYITNVKTDRHNSDIHRY